MSSNNAPLNISLLDKRLLDHIGRSVAYTAAALVILVGIYLGVFKENLFYPGLGIILFPHVIDMVSRRIPSQHQFRMRCFNLHLDALLCGLFIAFLDGSLEISSVFFILLISLALAVGKPFIWLTAVLALAGGFELGIRAFDFYPGEALPTELFGIAILGCGFFFSLQGYFSNRQNQILEDQTEILIKMDQQLKSEFQKQSELSEQVARYLSPQVRESILKGHKEAKLETQRKKLVVFFSDIVGFSALSDRMEAEALTEVLNGYLTDMSDIAHRHGGTIDKFIGDGIMIFFGDPKSKGAKRDALACVNMAIEMRRHMLKLRSRWSEMGMTSPLQIRMGISTGYCTVGNFGTEQRMDYTILGREVNLASRLESEADAGEILISHETHALVKDKIICRSKGTAMVKGFRDPVPLYQVVDYRRDLGSNPGFMNHETEGFSIYLESDRIKETERESVADALEKAAARLRKNSATNHAQPLQPKRPALKANTSQAKTIK